MREKRKRERNREERRKGRLIRNVNKGKAHFELSEFEEAERRFYEAMALLNRPSGRPAALLRGRVFRKLGDVCVLIFFSFGSEYILSLPPVLSCVLAVRLTKLSERPFFYVFLFLYVSFLFAFCFPIAFLTWTIVCISLVTNGCFVLSLFVRFRFVKKMDYGKALQFYTMSYNAIASSLRCGGALAKGDGGKGEGGATAYLPVDLHPAVARVIVSIGWVVSSARVYVVIQRRFVSAF